MECNELPTCWDESSEQQQIEYRRHIEFCLSCRQRVLREFPDQLLFGLNESELPADFWIGFWDSLHRKIGDKEKRAPMGVARWAAVAACAAMLVLYGRNLDRTVGTETDHPGVIVAGTDARTLNSTTGYPLIEDLKRPGAVCYIFQTSRHEKIVMMFDPDMEL